MVRPMVHSEKHYTQHSLFTTAAGARDSVVLINAVVVLNKNLSEEVEQGSSVKAIYVEFWINTNDTSPGTFIAILEKVPSGGAAATFAEMAALSTYANKKNVLYTTMGLTNPNTQTGQVLMKFWVKIPKGKQRFGLGDRFVLGIASQTGTLKTCGFSTYKEYK